MLAIDRDHVLLNLSQIVLPGQECAESQVVLQICLSMSCQYTDRQLLKSLCTQGLCGEFRDHLGPVAQHIFESFFFDHLTVLEHFIATRHHCVRAEPLTKSGQIRDFESVLMELQDFISGRPGQHLILGRDFNVSLYGLTDYHHVQESRFQDRER